jgi:hypothetical protein
MEFEFDDFTCSMITFDVNNNNKLLFWTATEIFQFDYTAPEQF